MLFIKDPYLKEFKSGNSKIEISKIKKYFINSNFQDNLIIICG